MLYFSYKIEFVDLRHFMSGCGSVDGVLRHSRLNPAIVSMAIVQENFQAV